MKLAIVLLTFIACAASAAERPHVVLVMADDMGWGQTGYYGHPVLRTPNLDAMAAGGLRFDRFYAGASNCSPTRASVLTGRSNDRTGVWTHGFPLRQQEKTIAEALRAAGYATGHFGKWHLNGLRGPGVPILRDDSHGPGEFGFDHWISVTNFFDRDPILSRGGTFEEFAGDSSEIVVDLALDFIRKQVSRGKPSFSVIWYGTPHSPFRADPADMAGFGELDTSSANHYGELVAMDRSIGTLREGLRELGVSDDTLVWFCSDNGGLPRIKPGTVGPLRGFKNAMYEGGLRVPAIIEWPARVRPRVSSFPACTMDIFPTVAAVAGLPESAMLQPQDGTSLEKLLDGEIGNREKPIPFRHNDRPALIDNGHKLIKPKAGAPFELYNLAADPGETKNIIGEFPKIAARLKNYLQEWEAGVERSIAGEDYPEGKIAPDQPQRRFWMEEKAYEPYFDAWRKRPEYRARLKKQ